MTLNKIAVLAFAAIALSACDGDGKDPTTDSTIDFTVDKEDPIGDADTDADSDSDADTDADSDTDTDTSDTFDTYVGGAAVSRPADRGWRLVVPEDEETDTTNTNPDARQGEVPLDVDAAMGRGVGGR